MLQQSSHVMKCTTEGHICFNYYQQLGALLATQKTWPFSFLRLDVEAVSRSHRQAPTPPHRCCHAARPGSTPLCFSAGDKEKPINMMERVVNLLAR